MHRVQIHIKGNFGDTGYRYFIKHIANLNHISEDVSYSNNNIIINASGSKSNLAEFIKYCFSGPPEARVEEFSIKLDNTKKTT